MGEQRGAVRLLTEIPGPRSRQLMALREQHVPAAVFHVAPIFVAGAKGAVLEDVDGNRLLDFAGGIGTMNVGHGRPEVVEAVRAQAECFTHTCFHVAQYEPYVRLAEKLNQITPGRFPKKTVLVSTGAEAVENAVKIARRATGRPAVITFENAFHGRTFMAMSLTSKVNPYKQGFGPFAPDVARVPSAYCYRCAFGLEPRTCGLHCAHQLEHVFGLDLDPAQVAAVILEPVQGEGGFIVPPDGFVAEVAEVCRKHGILFIADEIQTGFGRTGRLFAVDHWGVEPDIILTAKSLGAGLPIAAVTGRAELMDRVQAGGLGGTYGGNPVAAAAALKVIELTEREDLPARASDIGRRVQTRFLSLQARYALVGEVRGLGAMVAMELVADRVTREPASAACARVVKGAYQRGLVTIKAGVYNNIIRFLAPLTISDGELEEGLDILEESVAEANLAEGLVTHPAAGD